MLPCDILIKNAAVLMPDMSIAKNQTIAISGSRILEIADTDNSDQTISCQAETVIDDPHLLWMPGLTDGHLHTSQQFLRGSLLDEKPVIWKRINVPFEASLTEETMALSARLAGAEMIKCGTTSFVDAGGPHIEAAAEEYLKMGMRGALTWQTTDGANVPDGLRIDTREALPRLEKFHREYHGKDGLLKVYYSVTSLMACTEDLFYTIFLAAKEQNVTAECHMNEYASEVLDFIERYGERPFLYLDLKRENGLPPILLSSVTLPWGRISFRMTESLPRPSCWERWRWGTAAVCSAMSSGHVWRSIWELILQNTPLILYWLSGSQKRKLW